MAFCCWSLILGRSLCLWRDEFLQSRHHLACPLPCNLSIITCIYWYWRESWFETLVEEKLLVLDRRSMLRDHNTYCITCRFVLRSTFICMATSHMAVPTQEVSSSLHELKIVTNCTFWFNIVSQKVGVSYCHSSLAPQSLYSLQNPRSNHIQNAFHLLPYPFLHQHTLITPHKCTTLLGHTLTEPLAVAFISCAHSSYIVSTSHFSGTREEPEHGLHENRLQSRSVSHQAGIAEPWRNVVENRVRGCVRGERELAG